MAKIKVLLAIATIFNLLSNVYPSDSSQEIHFDKTSEESEEYYFKYKLDDGQKYEGKTFKLMNEIHLLAGANNTVYWVQIDIDMNEDEFTNIAHAAQRRKNKVFFEDNHHIKYLFDITNGRLFVTHHDTAWDLDDFCFSRSKTRDQTFDFTVSSINNSRKFNGTTRVTADPLIQRVDIHDEEQNGEYQINFTESELNTNVPFCRGINHIISGFLWRNVPIDRTNLNVLKSLAG